jgi:hypothetical protein
VTPTWLTAALRASGFLVQGEVLAVLSQATASFRSRTHRLQLRYSPDASPGLATRMILKRSLSERWAAAEGAEEVNFYRWSASLRPLPPAIVPCFAAANDPESGDSYLLLEDLSETHAPPITRDEQVSITRGIPQAHDLARVTDALARHHAYWWDHPLLGAGIFTVGYWSRNADRFARYLLRRRTAWEELAAGEASWFPADLLELYERVFRHLRSHWEVYLEPRFRPGSHLTLVHGDAYFANFLCPKDPTVGATYLIDWQSPSVDIGGYDLANLCATFWTSEQRHEAQREEKMLRHYYAVLSTHGVSGYSWDNLVSDYKAGLLFWLLMPLQDRYGGAARDYWWPKMQCTVAAFRDWRCEDLLDMTRR